MKQTSHDRADSNLLVFNPEISGNKIRQNPDLLRLHVEGFRSGRYGFFLPTDLLGRLFLDPVNDGVRNNGSVLKNDPLVTSH
jgi:hypothetical protein